MRSASDKRSPRALLLAIIVIFIYLACFQFDIARAYEYTVTHAASMLNSLGL